MFGNKASKINALKLSGDWGPGNYLGKSGVLFCQNPNKRKFGLQVLLLWILVGHSRNKPWPSFIFPEVAFVYIKLVHFCDR